NVSRLACQLSLKRVSACSMTIAMKHCSRHANRQSVKWWRNTRWRVSFRHLAQLWVCLLLVCSGSLQAHDARPVAVTLSETFPGIYQLLLRAPDTVAVSNQPTLVWPANCESVDQGSADQNLRRCADGLRGTALSLQYPLFNPSLATVFRIETLNGEVVTGMLPPTEAEWMVPLVPSSGQVALDYLWLGVEHIIGG